MEKGIPQGGNKLLVRENALIMLEYAKREAGKFSEYEEMFTASIVRMGHNRALSKKQEAIIYKIYAKYTGSPEREYHRY